MRPASSPRGRRPAGSLSCWTAGSGDLMALIVLTSASGSPGVTNSAVGLALTWPRPALLVEADPTGGSSVLAGYLRGQTNPTASLIDLALAHRQGQLEPTIPEAAVRIEGTSVSL